jgi:hypothetical protein
MTEFFRKNDCSRDNWPGQRPAAGFIYAGNARDAGSAEFFFIAKSATPITHRQKLSADCADFHSFFLATAQNYTFTYLQNPTRNHEVMHDT